jgi:DNA-binding transcriptional ArsR family regulator
VPFTCLQRLNLAVEEFRGHYPDAPALSLQAFLTVATNQGVPTADLKRRMGIPQPAMSRHLLLLSTWTWQGTRPSLDLIEIRDDPKDRRYKLSYLTTKGRLLACSLTRILDPGSDVTPADFMVPEVKPSPVTNGGTSG